jgi:prophage DNA circulation protein
MPQEDYWTSNLLDPTLSAGGDELTFPISDRKVEGGRDWAARRFPFRNGQSDEDTGGRPRLITYTVPLFRGVDEGDYPNLFNDLVEFVESDTHKGRATLTDPEFGPLPVRMTGYQWGTNAKAREGGELTLTFETLGDENFTLLSTDAADASEADATADAAATDSALADAGVTPKGSAQKMKDSGVPISETERLELGLGPSFSANVGLAPGVTVPIPTAPAVPSFTTSVTSTSGFGPTTVADSEVRLFTALTERFQSSVESGDLDNATDMAAAVDTMLARIAAVRGDTTLTTEAQWAVAETTTRLMAAVQRVGARAFRESPLVVDYDLNRELSALEVAVILFGSTNRTQDIIDLNPGLSPDFLPRGTTLIVPLE